LVNLSELPERLATKPVRSELVYALVELDKRYGSEKPSKPWPQFYARDLAGRFATMAWTRPNMAE
jgi:hypothetical protein